MTQREGGPAADPHGGLFLLGPQDHPDLHDSPELPDFHDPHDSGYLLDDYDTVEADVGRRAGGRATRGGHSGGHASKRRRRNRGLVAVLAALFIVVAAVGVYLVVSPIYRYLNPDDYAGSGTGTVIVTVHADDGATQIGTELHDRGVVASVRAFTNAAADDDRSTTIQPGSYRLRKHMSASSALTLLLEPSSRLNNDVLVPEGATTFDVTAALTTPQCSASSAQSTRCGPGLPAADVARALKDVKALGVPTEYTINGTTPTSVEGFLFPATYPIAGNSTAVEALQQMVNNFTENARQTNFTSAAKALHITPYQQLIIASIAQGEAKFADDYPKVARVILNRLAVHKPLQIDATSVYGAKLKGLDPRKVIYHQLDSPYNTYLYSGLPPTPIGNPGTEAMDGVTKPTPGKWMFYVNGDAEGHLAFFTSEAEFVKAAAKCRAHHWGCG